MELEAWLASGRAGTMRYLHRQARKRKEPQRIDRAARSVVVVLDNYFSADEPVDREPPRVAKYGRGTDYHRVTLQRLTQLADFLRRRGAQVARVYTDAGPVPERELAQRAGLGWIGKNTMLIRPGVGSFFFIGSVLTDLALPPDPPFGVDHCGSCTRCLEACPTEAILEPRVLDATRCISYLTIEYRGPIPGQPGPPSSTGGRLAATSATTCAPGTCDSPARPQSRACGRVACSTAPTRPTSSG